MTDQPDTSEVQFWEPPAQLIPLSPAPVNFSFAIMEPPQVSSPCALLTFSTPVGSQMYWLVPDHLGSLVRLGAETLGKVRESVARHSATSRLILPPTELVVPTVQPG